MQMEYEVGGDYLRFWPCCSYRCLWRKPIGRNGGVECGARGSCILEISGYL